MKILVVSNMFPDSTNPFYGIFVKKFCDQIRKIGINYDLSVMTKKNGIVGKIISYVVFYMKTVIKILFNKYDIVYIHYASYSSIPVLLANMIKKGEIFTNVHGSDVIPENKRHRILQRYTRKILAISDKVVVPSEYFKNVICDKYGIDASKIFIYPSGGVDTNLFKHYSEEENRDTRIQYGIYDDKPIFAFVGRISDGKGWDTFIEAISMLKEDANKANFIIVGNGPQDHLLKSDINSLHLEKTLIRIGMLSHEELARFYSAIDYLIFPTKRIGESLGLVAIEAMACGTPVIASDFAAPHYYMNDHINGRLFQMGNARALAKIIDEYIENRNEKAKLKIGAELTAEKYSEKNTREQLIKIFD